METENQAENLEAETAENVEMADANDNQTANPETAVIEKEMGEETRNFEGNDEEAPTQPQDTSVEKEETAKISSAFYSQVGHNALDSTDDSINFSEFPSYNNQFESLMNYFPRLSENDAEFQEDDIKSIRQRPEYLSIIEIFLLKNQIAEDIDISRYVSDVLKFYAHENKHKGHYLNGLYGLLFVNKKTLVASIIYRERLALLALFWHDKKKVFYVKDRKGNHWVSGNTFDSFIVNYNKRPLKIFSKSHNRWHEILFSRPLGQLGLFNINEVTKYLSDVNNVSETTRDDEQTTDKLYNIIVEKLKNNTHLKAADYVEDIAFIKSLGHLWMSRKNVKESNKTEDTSPLLPNMNVMVATLDALRLALKDLKTQFKEAQVKFNENQQGVVNV